MLVINIVYIITIKFSGYYNNNFLTLLICIIMFT